MVCFCEGATPFNLSVQASDLERLSLIIKDFESKASYKTDIYKMVHFSAWDFYNTIFCYGSLHSCALDKKFFFDTKADICWSTEIYRNCLNEKSPI